MSHHKIFKILIACLVIAALIIPPISATAACSFCEFINLSKGDKGDTGATGAPGYTPVFGVDYFNGTDGVNGYTPIKGVDYFDGSPGAPGYTPIFGVDYFNGSNGYTPIFGIDYFNGSKGDTGATGAPGTTDYLNLTNLPDLTYTPNLTLPYTITVTKEYGLVVAKDVHNHIIASQADGGDDSIIIQAAINACPTTGGTIYIKEGIYSLDAPNDVYVSPSKAAMVINYPIEIIGSSGTLLKFKDGITVGGGASRTCLAMFFIQAPSSTGDGVKIRNLNMDGNYANVTADTQAGIFVDTGSLLQFQFNHIFNFKYPITGDSGESTANQRFIITNNEIEGIRYLGGDAGGISIHNGGYYSIVSNNIIRDSAIGIFIDSTNSTIVTNNVILNSYYLGISLYDKVYDCLISDNMILGSNPAYGIVSSTTPPKPANDRNIIRDNVLRSLVVGIYLNGGDSNVIEGNTVSNMTSAPTSWIQSVNTTNTLIRANPGYPSRFADILDPISTQDAATKAYVDTITGNITIPSLTQYPFLNGTRNATGIWNFGGFNVSNLLNPVADQDAATKKWVEDRPVINSSYLTASDLTSYTTLSTVDSHIGSNRTAIEQEMAANASSDRSFLDDHIATNRTAIEQEMAANQSAVWNNMTIQFASVPSMATVDSHIGSNRTAIEQEMAANQSAILNNNTLTATNNFTKIVDAMGFRLMNITSNSDGGDAVNKTTLIAVNDSMRNNVSANFAPMVSGKVPTANLGGAGADATKYLRGDQSWQVVTASSPTSATAVVMASDFYEPTTNAVSGLLGAAVSSGTAAVSATTAPHPGVIAISDSTTGGGGYRYGCTATGNMLIGGGETFEIIF